MHSWSPYLGGKSETRVARHPLAPATPSSMLTSDAWEDTQPPANELAAMPIHSRNFNIDPGV